MPIVFAAVVPTDFGTFQIHWTVIIKEVRRSLIGDQRKIRMSDARPPFGEILDLHQ